MTTTYGIRFSELGRPTTPITPDFGIPGVILGDVNNYLINIRDILNLVNKVDLGLDKVDNIPDLQKPISLAVSEALSIKSDITHTHTFGEIIGLEDYISQRLLTHTHPMEAITGLMGVLDGKSNIGHGHSIDDVGGLVDSLNSKASVSHTHSFSDINGANETIQALWSSVNGKADLSHTHTSNEVTDFDPAVRQIINEERNNLIIVDVGSMEW